MCTVCQATPRRGLERGPAPCEVQVIRLERKKPGDQAQTAAQPTPAPRATPPLCPLQGTWAWRVAVKSLRSPRRLGLSPRRRGSGRASATPSPAPARPARPPGGTRSPRAAWSATGPRETPVRRKAQWMRRSVSRAPWRPALGPSWMRTRLPEFKDLPRSANLHLNPGRQPEPSCVITYTAGGTQRPKGSSPPVSQDPAQPGAPAPAAHGQPRARDTVSSVRQAPSRRGSRAAHSALTKQK